MPKAWVVPGEPAALELHRGGARGGARVDENAPREPGEDTGRAQGLDPDDRAPAGLRRRGHGGEHGNAGLGGE